MSYWNEPDPNLYELPSGLPIMGRDNSPQHTRRRSFLKTVGGGATIGISGLAGCSSQDGEDPGETTSGGGGEEVHVLIEESSQAFQDFFNRVNEDFEEETGNTVNMEFAGVGGVADSRMAQLLQAGDPPEVYMASATQVSQFMANDVAAPVTPAFENLVERFGSPIEASRAQADGEDYLAPLWGNIGCYWYRSDVYQNEPSTWDALLEEAESADGEAGLRGSWVGAGPAPCTKSQLLTWVYSNEGTMVERVDGEITVTIDQGSNRESWVETLAFLKELHAYSPQNSDSDCGTNSQAIATETSASCWYVGSRPKVQSIDQERGFAGDVASVPQPTPSADMDPTTFGLLEGFMTFDQANTELANEYIEFFFKPEYLNTVYFLTPLQNLPAFPELQETDGFQAELDRLVEDGPWTRHDIEVALETTDHFLTMPAETSPPNPTAGALLGSSALSDMMFDAVIRDEQPEDLVDKYAPILQDAVDEAQS